MLEWMKHLAARTRRPQTSSQPIPQFPAELVDRPYVLTHRFPEMWDRVKSEFRRAVSVYNAEVKDTIVTIQIATGDAISVRKPMFPSAYLDVVPDPDKGICHIRLEFYRSHVSTPRTREEPARFIAAGDSLLIQWAGRRLSAAEFVRAAFEAFFEGV